MYVQINFILMIFNLIPSPPLDGGWILRYMLPYKLQIKFDSVHKYGIILLYALLLTGFLEYLFVPVFYIIDLFYANIHIINIFVLIVTFIFGILVPYLLIKNEKSILYNQKKTKEKNKIDKKIQNEFEKTENYNLEIKNKYENILTSLSSEKLLDQTDNDFISELEKISNIESNLCNSTDFHKDDDHCFKCENFPDCVLRNLKTKFAEAY